MNNIYSSIINFYDGSKINYHKIKLLIDNNLKNGQNKFYLTANNFSCNNLSVEQRKKYYQNMVKLMPENTYFILELNFDSISDYQEIVTELEKSDKEFDLLIKNYECTDKDPALVYKEYLSLFKILDEKNLREFYLNIDTESLSSYNRNELLKDISEINDLEGLVISSSYPYDLDIDEIVKFKGELNNKLKLIGKADDFYYLNLLNEFKTISKYFNLLPNLFKKISEEYKSNNLIEAKQYQLKLNDFITFVNDLGEAKSFNFILNKKLNLSSASEKSLDNSQQKLLLAEFKKIKLNNC